VRITLKYPRLPLSWVNNLNNITQLLGIRPLYFVREKRRLKAVPGNAARLCVLYFIFSPNRQNDTITLSRTPNAVSFHLQESVITIWREGELTRWKRHSHQGHKIKYNITLWKYMQFLSKQQHIFVVLYGGSRDISFGFRFDGDDP
jgi:hypothetical protein